MTIARAACAQFSLGLTVGRPDALKFELQVACLTTVSESPTWLRLAGRFDEAHLAECTLLSGADLDVALLNDDGDEPHLPQPQARSLRHCVADWAGSHPRGASVPL